jgi:hypothetical protein
MQTDDSLRSLTEIRGDLAGWEAQLDEAATSLQAAQRDYETLTDRYRYSTDAGHAASFAEHIPSLEQAEQDAGRAAGVVYRNAQAVRERLNHELPVLSPEEEASAAAKATFAREDAERLPLPELAARVEHAVLRGDRAAMFTYARYGRMRLARGGGGDGAGEGATWPTDTGPDRERLARVIREAESRLRPGDLAGVETRALGVVSKASNLQGVAGKRTREHAAAAMVPQGAVRWPRDGGEAS